MGKKDNLNITESQRRQCNMIIHGASVAAGGVGTGLAQIPLADNAVISPIQIGMIIKLGNIFGHTVSESAAKAIVSSAAASFIGRGVSQVLFGWIPGIGNAVNTATAAGITEAIGWMAVKEFSSKTPKKSNNSSTVEQKNKKSAVTQEQENEDTRYEHDKNLADELKDQWEV